MEFTSGTEYIVDALLGSKTEGATRITVMLENVKINGTVVTADFGPNDYKLATMHGCTGCDTFTAILEGSHQTVPIQISEPG